MIKEQIAEYLNVAKQHVVETSDGQTKGLNAAGEAVLIWPSSKGTQLSCVGAPPYRPEGMFTVPTAEVTLAMRELFDGSLYRSFAGGRVSFDEFIRSTQDSMERNDWATQWHYDRGLVLVAQMIAIPLNHGARGLRIGVVNPESAAYAKYEDPRDLERRRIQAQAARQVQAERQQWDARRDEFARTPSYPSYY